MFKPEIVRIPSIRNVWFNGWWLIHRVLYVDVIFLLKKAMIRDVSLIFDGFVIFYYWGQVMELSYGMAIYRYQRINYKNILTQCKKYRRGTIPRKLATFRVRLTFKKALSWSPWSLPRNLWYCWPTMLKIICRLGCKMSSILLTSYSRLSGTWEMMTWECLSRISWFWGCRCSE